MPARPRDLMPLYVAMIGFLPPVTAVMYNAVYGTAREPCVVASAWIGDETPSTDIPVAERRRLSSVMVRTALECVK